MNIGTKTALAGAAALALTGAAVAVGAAGIASSAAADQPSGQHGAAAQQRQARGLGLGRLLHGDAVVKKGDQVLTVQRQRGEATAVSDNSITVKSEDGFEATYAIDQNTKVRKARQQAAASDIKTGEIVRVTGVKEGDGIRAVLIGIGKLGGPGAAGTGGAGGAGGAGAAGTGGAGGAANPDQSPTA